MATTKTTNAQICRLEIESAADKLAADKLTADGYSPQWFSGGGLYIAEGDDDSLAAIRSLLGDAYRCDWTGDEDDIGIEVAE